MMDSGVVQIILLSITTFGMIVNAILNYLTHIKQTAQYVKQDIQAAKQDVQAGKQDAQAAKIEAIHVATNSMKDALVASTEKEALARGILQGTVEGAAAEAAKNNQQ